MESIKDASAFETKREHTTTSSRSKLSTYDLLDHLPAVLNDREAIDNVLGIEKSSANVAQSEERAGHNAESVERGKSHGEKLLLALWR